MTKVSLKIIRFAPTLKGAKLFLNENISVYLKFFISAVIAKNEAIWREKMKNDVRRGVLIGAELFLKREHLADFQVFHFPLLLGRMRY